jgi:hypothetical protein
VCVCVIFEIEKAKTLEKKNSVLFFFFYREFVQCWILDFGGLQKKKKKINYLLIDYIYIFRNQKKKNYFVLFFGLLYIFFLLSPNKPKDRRKNNVIKNLY